MALVNSLPKAVSWWCGCAKLDHGRSVTEWWVSLRLEAADSSYDGNPRESEIRAFLKFTLVVSSCTNDYIVGRKVCDSAMIWYPEWLPKNPLSHVVSFPKLLEYDRLPSQEILVVSF